MLLNWHLNKWEFNYYYYYHHHHNHHRRRCRHPLRHRCLCLCLCVCMCVVTVEAAVDCITSAILQAVDLDLAFPPGFKVHIPSLLFSHIDLLYLEK
jgi:hypothetical protein